jgi:hypothetical protein
MNKNSLKYYQFFINLYKYLNIELFNLFKSILIKKYFIYEEQNKNIY